MATFPIDFNVLRIALIREVAKVTGLPNNRVIEAEPETQDVPRPKLPYMVVKITTPSAKTGDDSKDYDAATGLWNSGGVRQMTVGFEAFGQSHEDAYNYASLVQTAFDLADIQADLRLVGIAVNRIGSVADLSELLNTGYEGRARLEIYFGIAMNLESDLGSIQTVNVDGEITTDGGDEDTTTIQVVGP